MCIYIFSLINVFLLLCNSLLAGTFLSREDAEKGISRGIGSVKEDSFVSAVGQVEVECTLPDGTKKNSTSNGVLLNPKTLLCTRHVFTEGVPTFATVFFYPDTNIIYEKISKSQKAMFDPLDKTSGLLIRDVVTNLILSTLHHHPTEDVVIVELMRSLDKIAILPLVLERPIKTSGITGFVVSYSPVFINGYAEKVYENRRHLSTIDVWETRASVATPQTFFVKDFIRDTTSNKNELRGLPGELFAFTNGGDSGAPLIVPSKGVLAINFGLIQFEKGDKIDCLMKFIPLYLLKDWFIELGVSFTESKI